MDFWGVLTTSTAPWWYVGLLTGVLGVTGVVSGAVVSYKSVKASDERRHAFELQRIADANSRQDHQRWFDHIRALSAKLVGIDYAISLVEFEHDGDQDVTALGDTVSKLLSEVKENDNYGERKAELDRAMREFDRAVELNNKLTDLKNEMYACSIEIRLTAPNAISEAAGNLFDVSVDRRLANDEAFEKKHSKVHSRFIDTVKSTLGTREDSVQS